MSNHNNNHYDMPLSKTTLVNLLRPTSKRGDGLLKRSLDSLKQLAEERGLQIPDEPPNKRTRRDVADRKLVRKGQTLTVTKMCLSKLSFDAGKVLPIQNAVDGINQLTREAYLLANLHVLRLLDAKLPVSKLDQTFFYRCLCAVASSKDIVADVELVISAERYRELRQCAPADRSHLRGMLQDASKQMETVVKNHVSTNLYGRLRRHLRVRLDCGGSHAYRLLNAIFADEYTGNNPMVQHFRDKMPLLPTDRNMQQNPHLFMDILYYLERYNDSHTHLQGIRCFSLLPHTDGYTCKYIKISSVGLRALIAGCCDNVVSESEFIKQADSYWRKMFNVAKLETANRKFAGELLTDGKAVSVVMYRPKREDDKEVPVLQPADFDMVWGLDPGMRDLFVATNDVEESIRCSSADFYQDSAYTASRKKLELWKSKDLVILAIERNMPTKKTTDQDALGSYIRYSTRHAHRLTAFYGAKRFKNLKFKRFCASKKKLQQLVAKLSTSGKRTLVGFGDWSVGSSNIIKGCRPGPSTRLRRQLRQYATVVDVDEYRTSKTCNCCKQRMLANMVATTTDPVTGKAKRQKIHSVLHCKTSDCLSMTLNRDVNASRNILELTKAMLAGKTRPACFRRES